MANEFKIKNGFLSTGDSQVTGSLTVSNGITGSLFGTASYAENALTSSYAVIPNLQSGSVLFTNGSTGVVTGSSNLYWDNTNNILSLTKLLGPILRLNAQSSAVSKFQFTQEFSAGVPTEIGYISNQWGTGLNLNTFQDIYLNPANTTALRIFSSTRNVAIQNGGTFTDSGARLNIRGSGATSATTALRVENLNASASMVVLDNGFVGINTGSAQYALDVNGHVRLNTGFQLYFNNSNVGAYRDSNDLVLGGFGNIIFKSSNTNISSQTERARITSTGLFGIGTSSPSASLHVVGTALISGSQTITGSLIVTEGITGSLFGTAATASFTPNALTTASVSSNTITFTKGDGTTFPITIDTGSGGSTFPYTGSAIISGSLEITGSFSVNNGTALKIDTITSTLTDDGNISSIDWQNRYLNDQNNLQSLNWGDRRVFDSNTSMSADWRIRTLFDNSETISTDWINRQLFDSNASMSADWRNRQLFDSNTSMSADWRTRNLFDSNESSSLDWNTRQLNNAASTPTVDWNNNILYDSNAVDSVNWDNRNLVDSNFKTSTDWRIRNLFDSNESSSLAWQARQLNNTSGNTVLTWLNEIEITKSTVITGSLTVTSGITGSLNGTASFATTASHALNGGVTQLIAGTNISLSPAGGTGAVTINSTGGGPGGDTTAVEAQLWFLM